MVGPIRNLNSVGNVITWDAPESVGQCFAETTYDVEIISSGGTETLVGLTETTAEIQGTVPCEVVTVIVTATINSLVSQGISIDITAGEEGRTSRYTIFKSVHV